MEQALLITAYKNIHHLKHIINHFDGDFSFYIHIDKKSQVSRNEILELKQASKNIFISQNYKTNWGGVNHLKCTLLLMKEALLNKKIEYIHLISGHDFPIKSSSYFTSFLEENKGKQFFEYFSLPTKIWENGGMDRLNYYNLYDTINAKGKYERVIRKIINLQKKLGFKRHLNFDNHDLYGGSTWWTLSYDCCKYIDDFIKKTPKFLKQFEYTFCAEEIFFQTIVMNSPFKGTVVNDNLRYIVWEFRNGNIPANLDETDYNELINNKQLFARRFEYPVSENLVMRLIQQK